MLTVFLNKNQTWVSLLFLTLFISLRTYKFDLINSSIESIGITTYAMNITNQFCGSHSMSA